MWPLPSRSFGVKRGCVHPWLDGSEIRDSQSFLGVLAVVQQLKVWGAICSREAVKDWGPKFTFCGSGVWVCLGRDSIETGTHYIANLDWLRTSDPPPSPLKCWNYRFVFKLENACNIKLTISLKVAEAGL